MPVFDPGAFDGGGTGVSGSLTWQSLIDRARLYVSDDDDKNPSWIKNDKWLVLGNVELTALRRRWASMGLVNPATVDQAFTTASVTLSNVFAIVGVAEVLSTSTPYRVLRESQSGFGATPVWGSYSNASHAESWAATGFGDAALTVTIDPPIAGKNYIVRYAANLPYATDATTSPDLPTGADERLVLGMARRAGIKDRENSNLVNQLIMEQDRDLMFTAFGRLRHDSPRVRRVDPRVQARAAMGFPTNPRFWRYP